MIPENQRESAAFLEEMSGAKARETHISAVFRGTDTVWKLKKAVTLPFVDFSTPAARKRFLLRELELNRPMAPEIYRDVAAIVRDEKGRLGFGPADAADALDYVLRMAVIPPGCFLDEVAAKQGLDPELCRAIADMVVRMHGHAQIADPPAPAERMRRLVVNAARDARHAGIEAGQAAAWEERALTLLAGCAKCLAERQAAGLVRRAHGDLHLGNLCLWHGAVLPFDALEFDEDLATIDLGYDLAFLLMDVEIRASREAANRILNRYAALTGDVGLLRPLPLFLSLRAMIRAHVTKLSGGDGAGYLAAALRFAAPAPSPVLAIGGLPGTGKSTLARKLAPGLGAAPGALILRSDELRKRLNGVPPETRLPEAAYSPAANAVLDAALLDAARLAAASGHGLIVDATFLSPELRSGIEAIAAAAHRDFRGIWLEAPMQELEARLAARKGDASDAGIEVLQRAAAKDTGAITWERAAPEAVFQPTAR